MAEQPGGRTVDLIGDAEPGSASMPGPGETITATVRYFAAARAAAGTPQETVTVRADATIDRLLAVAVDRHGAELAAVLLRCSYLLDAVAVHSTQQTVAAGQTLDVLPPFAGG